jgi:signal transduction histidine kinase
MHTSVHKKVRLGFLIAFSVVIIASICSYLVMKNLLDHARWQNHTIEVSRRLEVITKQLQEAEAALRGYRLTQDTSFLRPSMRERSQAIAVEYEHLREVTKRNSTQQSHLDTLRELLAHKYQQLMAPSNPRADTAGVQAGEKSMDLIDTQVRAMLKIEESHLHSDATMQSFYSAIWAPALLISSLMAILVGLYAYITLNREFKLQLHVESRLKSYQKGLQQNISLLNKSNEELEQFAYVASHDLQEPLRKISTFSDRLQTKYGELLPPEAHELLDRMTSAVGRMRVLINDLLLFSRAGRITPESLNTVDMGVVLNEVLSDLELVLQEKKVAIHVGNLPILEGSHTSFHQLLQNIITNAIKFAQPGRPLVIDISSRIIDGPCAEITIADNGIGFDPAYAERIFLLFQRLHGMSEYSGTGIGLAICKKIVESHHGSIHATGQPGEGAQFIVTLPLTQTLQDEQY